MSFQRNLLPVSVCIGAFALVMALVGCSKAEQEDEGEKTAAATSESATSQPTTSSGSSGAILSPGTSVGSSQEALSGAPPIQVVPRTLDWGTVAPRATTTGSVRLTNTSDKPLKIITVQPSCKCTTTEDLNGTTIPPRGSVDLDAVFDAQPTPGPRTTEIRVLFEGYGNVLTIPAKADVARPVRVRPPYINAVEGKSPTGNYMVNSLDGNPFKVLGVQGKPPPYLQPGDADTLKGSYVLKYDIADYLQPDGRYPRFIVVETDRADAPLVEVMLRHELSMPELNRNLKLTDYKANLGRVAPGASVVHEIGVRESTTTGPLVTVLGDESVVYAEIIEQNIDEESDDLLTKVRFTVPAGTEEGFYYFPLRIYASNQAEVSIPAFISVRTDPGRLPENSGAPRSSKEPIPLDDVKSATSNTER